MLAFAIIKNLLFISKVLNKRSIGSLSKIDTVMRGCDKQFKRIMYIFSYFDRSLELDIEKQNLNKEFTEIRKLYTDIKSYYNGLKKIEYLKATDPLQSDHEQYSEDLKNFYCAAISLTDYMSQVTMRYKNRNAGISNITRQLVVCHD